LFKNKVGSKRLWPGDARDVDAGTDVGPIQNQQTLLEHYNVDAQLKLMMHRSFEGFGPKQRGGNTALANKGINVAEAAADFDAARQSNSMSVEATKLRSRVLGHHNRAREVYGKDVVGAPLLFAMIDSGDYVVEEYCGPVNIGDFSDPRYEVAGEAQSKSEDSSDGSESESEGDVSNGSGSESEGDVSDGSDSESESEERDGSGSEKESDDSDVNSSERGSGDAKRVRTDSATAMDEIRDRVSENESLTHS
jgi:hypothetical protein